MTSPTSSSAKRKAKPGGGGNPLKMWPTPKGQHELRKFFGGELSSGTGSGCCSSSSSEEGLETTKPESGKVPESTSATSSQTPMNLLEDITQLNSDSDND